MRKNHGKQIVVCVLSGLIVLGAGCKSIGPKTIPRDRFDYSSALAESWKNQMLLNIVKVRYLDLPIFLDVGQVVSGYTLETTGNIGGQVSSSDALLGNRGTIGAGVRYTDRPTITYTPLTGDRFLEGFLTPIKPVKIFSLIQAGYSADFILELGVDSFNGLRNQPVRINSLRIADPKFFQLLTLLTEIQDAGAIGLRITEGTAEKPDAVVFFSNRSASPELKAKIAEAHKLLGLAEGTQEFRLISSALPGGPGELSVGTRSLSQMLAAMSLGVAVPDAHHERGFTPPMRIGEHNDRAPLLRIHSGDVPTDGAYAKVQYEDEWFWIANDDWHSKRTFSSILFLFTLAETGGQDRMPTITIPAQ